MYLVVRKSDSVVVLSASQMVDEEHYKARGCVVIEIPQDQYSPDIVGAVIELPEEVLNGN